MLLLFSLVYLLLNYLSGNNQLARNTAAFILLCCLCDTFATDLLLLDLLVLYFDNESGLCKNGLGT